MAAELNSMCPAAEVKAGPYELRKVKAPVLTGLPLRLFIRTVLEGPLFHTVVPRLFRDNGYTQVLEERFVPESPTYRPHTAGWPEEAAGGLVALPAGQAPPQRAAAAAQTLPGFSQKDGGSSATPARRSVADFHRAYLAGEVTPSQVAENVIQAVRDSESRDPPMRFLISWDPEHIREQAAASTARYAAGAPLSPLDGVPFAVKDGGDAAPYPTTAGTAFMAAWRKPTGTNPGVASLMAAGAILIGKANLHEIGCSTTGLNTVHGTARNPHDVWRHTGGSSSGSAALVAAGVCPFAIGSDGGGSIRIPASLCGVVGLMPTHDRISTRHGAPIDQTVMVLGPIAGCVEDCALMYALAANVGHGEGHEPPPLRLPRPLRPAGERPLEGKVAGVYWKWFEDAEPAVVAACRAALGLLEAAGLEVREVEVPELEELRVAHTCTIISEMRNNMAAALSNPAVRAQFNLETRASLGVAANFSAAHYIQAQKIRTRAETHFRRVFEEGGCHYIVTPTVPCVAPAINRAALSSGITDIATTIRLMRFMPACNMLGLPAISVPVGAVPTPPAGGQKGGPDSVMLPVGLQLVAPPWHEASLLAAGAVLEAAVGEGAVPRPAVLYDVLRPAAQQ